MLTSTNVLWTPKAALRFDDSIGGFTGLCTELYSWLQFIPMKGYRINWQRKKVHRAKSAENKVPASKGLHPVESLRMCSTPPAMSCDHTHEMSTGKLLRNSVPEVFTPGLYVVCRHL